MSASDSCGCECSSGKGKIFVTCSPPKCTDDQTCDVVCNSQRNQDLNLQVHPIAIKEIKYYPRYVSFCYRISCQIYILQRENTKPLAISSYVFGTIRY